MAKGDHIKPNRNKQYSKTESELAAEDTMMSEAESDQDFKVEASMASEDYSAQSDEHLSDKELLRRFRTSLTSNILPTVPEISGYHVCWVPEHSNNIYDTVNHRKQIGYSVVKPEEVPSYMNTSNRAGTIEACVSFNELVLMKIPTRLYQLYMKDSHHTQPNEQERVIKQSIKQMEDKDGASVVRDEAEMTGIRNLARKVAEPTF